MKTYPIDFRKQVLKVFDQKQATQKEIASRFGVSLSWLEKLLRQRRQTNSISPRQRGGDYRSIFTGKHLDYLKQMVEKYPDATLAELEELCGLKSSYTAVWRALKKLGYTRKKRRYVPPSKTVQT